MLDAHWDSVVLCARGGNDQQFGWVKAVPQSSSSITNVEVYLAPVPFSSLIAKAGGMETSARNPSRWGSLAGD